MRNRFRRKRRKLDKRAFFSAAGGATTGFNEPGSDWAATFDTKCALYPAPGTEKYANSENAETSPVLIEVRAEQRTLSLTPANRVAVDGVTYEIVSLDQQERGANIIISAVNNGV